MEALSKFWRELTLKPQGMTVVIAGFLPIIAIVAMGPAVPAMIGHFASDPEARGKVPAMIGAPGLAMAILAPFAGILVDRFGRRPLLLLCTALYAVFGSAPLFLDNLDQIYVSRLLLGVSEAGILTVVNTLIGDYWDDKARKNWLFLQGMMGPLLGASVALLVGYATRLQWNGVFYVYLIALPIFAMMFAWLFEPQKRSQELLKTTATAETASPFPWGKVVRLAAVTFFASMLYYVFIINGTLVFKEVGVDQPERYGAIIFIPSLMVLGGAALFRLLAMRRSGLQFAVMFALLGTGLAGIGLASTLSAMVAFLVVQQVAVGMAVPVLIAWAQGMFGFDHRGRAMGIWTGAFFLGQSQSPRLVHILDAQMHSMQSAFLVAGVLGLVAAGIALSANYLPRRRAEALGD